MTGKRSTGGTRGRNANGSSSEQPVSASVEAQLRALAALALAEAAEMQMGTVKAGGRSRAVRGRSDIPQSRYPGVTWT
eukprot:CAMPEP_0119493980 /NCGR_PEP_ID=MMETSP1344-20130328/18070_1 /TAXON_ID=236787 /ORGANISM="Florenciella parvula, Strain CCMP2471" /LENGTH=77 /DNA_ID=CAMNT_0007529447 /DNA_START=1 /DNA_END=230 /DNA_ORIENTATION=+